jgi:hypothetical protein
MITLPRSPETTSVTARRCSFKLTMTLALAPGVGLRGAAKLFNDKHTMLFDLADCGNDASTPQ